MAKVKGGLKATKTKLKKKKMKFLNSEKEKKKNRGRGGKVSCHYTGSTILQQL